MAEQRRPTSENPFIDLALALNYQSKDKVRYIPENPLVELALRLAHKSNKSENPIVDEVLARHYQSVNEVPPPAPSTSEVNEVSPPALSTSEVNEASQPAPSTLEVIDRFLASSYAPRSPNSKLSYKQTWAPFSREFHDMPTTPEPIEQYANSHNNDNTTRWNILVRLRCVYRFAEERLGLSPNPFKLIKVTKGQAEEAEPIDEEQGKALYQAIETNRERVYFYTMYGQGFRLSEVIGLNCGDIRGDKIWLEKGKERKEWAPLLSEVRDVLLMSGNGRGANQPIIVGRQGRVSDSTVQSDIKRWFERAGVRVKRTSPHTLRHSFATHVYRVSGDWNLVQLLLRHKVDRREVTNVYLHLSPEQRLEMLRQKLEQYSPIRMLKSEAELGKKPDFAQLEATELLPQLLDQMVALGETANQLKQALGSNGHKAEAQEEIKQYLEHQASK